MGQTEEMTSSLQKISEIIGLLDNSSKELLGMMDEQIDAVIASDAEKIEQLSELHNSLAKEYKEYEGIFIKELTGLLANSAHNDKQEDQQIRLVHLKEMFPSSSDLIDGWLNILSENTKQLQNKHNQILELLEFAMNQNAKMMHSMYTMHHEKDMHYAANGNQSGVRTGVAVNQEI